MTVLHNLNFTVPITESTKSNQDFVIRGVAINETVTRNGTKFVAEELQSSAHTLVNKPLLKDHNNSVDAIVGRVIKADFDSVNKNISFEARIVDEVMKDKIEQGLITSVSVGAMVSKLDKVEEENGNEVLVAKGIDFVELSLVGVPADPNAGFAYAISEAYNAMEKQNNKIETRVYVNNKEDARMAENIKEKAEDKVEEKALSKAEISEMIKSELKEGLDTIKTPLAELAAELKTLVKEEVEPEAKEEEEEKKKDVTKGEVGAEEKPTKESVSDNFIVEREGGKLMFYAKKYDAQKYPNLVHGGQ